jgi:hypothetical protein
MIRKGLIAAGVLLAYMTGYHIGLQDRAMGARPRRG